MAEGVKRRRLTNSRGKGLRGIGNCVPSSQDSFKDNIAGREKWNGFCEIESEPALFNVMLREFGVKGVKFQEVFSLDEEMLQLLPRPVYGLVFLFRWIEDDPEKQEASCPDQIWFANQTASNACASVALLNIVNNIDTIELGEHLKRFKEFTMPFTPALRGDAINHFEFIKQIHNSFARKMDILNLDFQLKNDSVAKRFSGGKRQLDTTSSEAAFHFSAFVPVIGRVWKFDGLERQPQSLGNYSANNWLELVKPELMARMTEYTEDQIEFSILSLVRDPIVDLVGELALNVKSLQTIETRLREEEHGETVKMETIEVLNGASDCLFGPDLALELTQQDIDQAEIPLIKLEEYRKASFDLLIPLRNELAASQNAIKRSIQDELQSRRADENHAAGRRHDYNPAISFWARSLAKKGLIQDLAIEFMT